MYEAELLYNANKSVGRQSYLFLVVIFAMMAIMIEKITSISIIICFSFIIESIISAVRCIGALKVEIPE